MTRPSTAAAILAVLAVVLLPVAYVVVIGPVLWLSESGYLPEGISRAYCVPAAFVAARSETCNAWLHAYARLCVPEQSVYKYPAPD